MNSEYEEFVLSCNYDWCEYCNYDCKKCYNIHKDDE